MTADTAAARIASRRVHGDVEVSVRQDVERQGEIPDDSAGDVAEELVLRHAQCVRSRLPEVMLLRGERLALFPFGHLTHAAVRLMQGA